MESTDIFLSYASEDRNRARSFVAAFEEKGWSVWWDRAIEPGTHYEQIIDRAISRARCVVVLWSPASILSSWVSNESLEGLERGILVPVKLASVRVPVVFRGLQAALLDDWPQNETSGEFDKLCAAIRGVLKGQPAVADIATDAAHEREGREPNRRAHELPQNSVAVLPFVNLTGNSDLDYVGDGLSDELRISLSKSRSLHVVPRSSSAYAAGRSDDVRVVGQMLDAARVVEGRMQRFGNAMRLSVEIANVENGYQTWASSYALSDDTLLEVSDRLSADVAESFRDIVPADKRRSHQPDAEAYQCYLRARFHFNAGDTLNRRRAITQFEKAIEIDPEFPAAHCGLASAYLLRHIGSNDPYPPEETFAAAVESGQRAFALEPDSALSIGIMGFIYFTDWQWSKAEEFLSRSLALDPNDTVVRHTYASLLNFYGRTVEAAEFMEQTLAYEPLSPIAVNGTARILRYLGRFEDAHAVCERLLSAMPDALAAIEEMAESSFAANDYDAAEKFVEEEARQLGADHPTVIWSRLRICRGRRQHGEMLDHFSHLKLVARNVYVNSAVMAFCHLFAGDTEGCLDYLERGVKEKDPWLTDLALLPLPKVLTQTERFRAVLDAVQRGRPTVA